ncbi:putative UNC93-like protein 3, plant [Helianthus annuus]|nr:putative UNC93-like protein 3, plant [Helianthus annuus]
MNYIYLFIYLFCVELPASWKSFDSCSIEGWSGKHYDPSSSTYSMTKLLVHEDDGSNYMMRLQAGNTSGTTLLFTIFLGSMTLGMLLMSFLKKRDVEETEGERDASFGFYTFLVSLWKQVVTPLCDMRLLLIVPLIAFSGLRQAFVWAEFTKYYVQPSLGESGVGGAMAVYGAFDAICSLVAGRFTSGLTSITLIVSGGAFLQGGVLIWLLNYSEPTGILRLVYPLLIAAIWGIGNGVLMTQLNALLAMLFKDMEGMFAQLKFWQSASTAVVFFLSPYISLQTMLFLLLAAFSFSLAGFLFLVLKVEKVFSYHPS